MAIFNFNPKRIFAGILSFAIFFMYALPIKALASDITGVTPTGTGNTYNIEAAKVSGSTGFRHYNNFKLDKGDIANLLYRTKANKEYSKFVNLVDNRVNINGIVNTMKGNNFYNGHAIFVSPQGIVIGASGVLNVGALTLMAPSQNSYNAFKKLYENDSHLSRIEYDKNNANYKSLITNSSGTITVNGKIFAKESVEAYGRNVTVKKDSTEGGNPAIFAGVQNQDVITDLDMAETLFNSLVNIDVTSANGMALEDGKVALVTNRANEEIITTQTEDNKTEAVNVNVGLKTTTTGTGDSATKAYAKDSTYDKSSLSSDASAIEIEGATIISNEVDIQANATSSKIVDADAINNYNSSTGTKTGTSDTTSGKIIPNSFKGMADEAKATVTIKNSKIAGEKVSITAKATNKSTNYIQLLDPIWEKWLNALKDSVLSDASEVLTNILEKMGVDIGHDAPDAADMVTQYFSDKAYSYLDGASSIAKITISDDSKILAKNSVKIESNASATTKIATGDLDSYKLFMYGLGAKSDSSVDITGSTIKTAGSGKVDVNAYSKTSNTIKYDSTKFISAKADTPSDMKDKKGSDGDSNNDGGNSGSGSGNSGNDNNNNGSSGDTTPATNDSNNNDSSGDPAPTAGDSNNNGSGNDNSDSGSDSGNGSGSDSGSGTGSGEGNSGNDSEQQTKKRVDSYNLVLLNNSIISDANVKISGSNIETGDLTINAIGFNQGEVNLKNISYIGTDADKTGIAVAVLISHISTNSNAEIKDSSVIKAKNDVNLLSQNINYFDNYLETEVKAGDGPKTVSSKTGTFTPSYSILAYEWLNKKILGKVKDKIGDALDKLKLEISGSAIWNNEHNTSTASISGSTVDAKNVSVESNMLDLMANGAEAYATAGNSYSVGVAVVVNDENNTNNAKVVDDSQITADGDVTINATTQLPMNPMELKIGQKVGSDPTKQLNLSIGASFDQGESSVTDWNVDFLHTQLDEILKKDSFAKIKAGIGDDPVKFIRNNKISLDGLFNNYAEAQGAGENLGISGSIVAHSLNNITNAFIDGSKVNSNGGININAANSIVNYNAAGKVDFLITELNNLITTKPDLNLTSSYGIGGSVLVTTLTNDAKAYINNSTVTVDEGDININSAQEEAYVNLLVTGAKSKTLAVDGSVNVQRIKGSTKAYIDNSENISADNIIVNAGKAKISPKKSGEAENGESGDPIELDEDTNQLSVGEERDVKDSVLSVSLLGVNANGEGSGVSVGASVDVANNSKKTKAYINNSTVTAKDSVTVEAKTDSKKIDVLLAGAFNGGVSPDKNKQKKSNSDAGVSNNDSNTSNNNDESGEPAPAAGDSNNNSNDSASNDESSAPHPTANVGNWMDEMDAADDDAEDVMNLNNLFKEENPNTVGADNAKTNKDNIANQNNTVDNDGNIKSNSGENNANNPGNNNGKMADGAGDVETAKKNFSIAIAGTIGIYNDLTETTSEITNSNINVGKSLNTTADRDNLVVNVLGGLAKSGNIGGGAAVLVYKDAGKSIADINNSTVVFTSGSAKNLNVISKNNHDIVNVAVGVGVAKGQKAAVQAALGGSFNTVKLEDTTQASIQNTSVSAKTGDANDIDAKAEAKSTSVIWNAAGDLGYTQGTNNTNVSIGAGVAGNLNQLKQEVIAEVTGNKELKNIKDLTIHSDLTQDTHSIGIAGAITTGAKFSFNIDGALGLEILGNEVTALLQDSIVSAGGDVKVNADSKLTGQTLTGGVEYSSAQNSAGVGIGSVIVVDNSKISAKIEGTSNDENSQSGKIEKSNSVEVKANSKDERQFLTVNLGIQNGDSTSLAIIANGIISIFKQDVESGIFGKYELNSNGAVSIYSGYDSKSEGITAVADKTKDGLGIGASIIATNHTNTVKSNIEKNSKINSSQSVSVEANSQEKLDYIPIAIGINTNNGNGIAADVVVNIVKNTTMADVYGDIITTGAFDVLASDVTTIYERGGVLQYSGGVVGIGATVFYDYLNKKVTSEVKGNTVSATDVTVKATSDNSLGGTQKTDKTWDESEMSKDSSSYGAGFEHSSSFKNWNMAYSLAHGDKVSVSGSILVRVLDNIIKANVEDVNLGTLDNKASSLKISADDYTLMNMIAGQFSASGQVAVGSNVVVIIGGTDTQATLTGGNQYLSGDLSVKANTKKLSHAVIVGGSGSGKVAINGSAYVNKIDDKTTSSIIGSEVVANKVAVNSNQMNDSLGVSVSVAGSGTASVGAILYMNLFADTTKALVGDNSTNKNTKITSESDIEVKSDSDYEAREYLLSVGASGKVGISGLGIANVISSTIESGIYKSDVTSNNGKFEVFADRGFNRIAGKNKTAFFRDWFKSTDAYKNQGVNKTDNSRSVITENDLGKLAPIVGAINVSASGTAAVTGSIIVNKTAGSLTAKIDNSVVSAKNGTTVNAKQDFTNFDAVAAVAGSGHASLSGVGVVNNLSETVTAQVNQTTVNSGEITTDAQSNMNLNQLVVSGQGAGQGAGIGVVVDKNDINDKVYSYISNTTAEKGANANSQHNIMINNILLAGGGVGQGLEANVAVIVNNFTGETFSKIEGSTINGGDIKLSSFDNIDNLSAVAGISFAGQGANLAGYAIRNALSNKANAFINNSTINTSGGINITADSVISTTNAIFTAGIAGQGATILANVISNTVTSDVEGYIKNSTITKSGDVKITANVNNDENKYRYDGMTNTTGNVSFAGMGASLSTNVIYTNYANKVKTYVENTSSEKMGSLTLDANSERRLDNINIGIGGAAIGADVGVNAISTNIETETLSYIDAKLKKMGGVGSIGINSRDDSDIKNTMGMIQIAGLGVAAGVTLDMTWNNSIAKSEIKSTVLNVPDVPDRATQTDDEQSTQEVNNGGEIIANSVSLKSDTLLEYDKTNVGVSAGFVGLAGDYVLIKSGKKAGSYTDSEKKSKINDAISKLDSQYVPTVTGDTKVDSGAVSNIDANLTAKNNIDIKSESKIKGRGNSDSLNLSNVTVTVGIGSGSVGVKDVDLASNTISSISGGTVNSTEGKVSLDSKSTSNVKITSTRVDVSGVTFSGGSSIYNNNSETVSQIGSPKSENEVKETAVLSKSGIDVVSNSTSNSTIDATTVVVTGSEIVGVDLAENIDKNHSTAMVTGKTDIHTKGKLNLHSTANTDLSSTKATVKVELGGGNIVSIMKNEVEASTLVSAIMKDIEGNVVTSGLDMISDYGTMSAFSKSNVTAVSLAQIVGLSNSGSKLNATFTSGIYKIKDGKTDVADVTIDNDGKTTIETAKKTGSNNLVAKSEINNVSVTLVSCYTGVDANAENTATSNTILKAKDHSAESLDINSHLDSTAVANAGSTKVTAIGVSGVSANAKDTSNLNVDIDGANTIKGNANVNAIHNASVNSDLNSFTFSLVGGGRIRIGATNISNTVGSIAGDFNVLSGNFTFDTTRQSTVSKSSGGGGIISVSDSQLTNTLTGSSVLNIKDFRTDNNESENNLKFTNKSTNNFDVQSSDASGGLIAVAVSGLSTTLDTTSEINISSTTPKSETSTNINSEKTVSFEVENNSVVNETSSNEGGGFVAVTTNNVNNTYKSNAKLTIKDSEINAKNVDMKTLSFVRSKGTGWVEYVGGASGFIATNDFKVNNTIQQQSEIDIINSIIKATDKLTVNSQSRSYFAQKIESAGRGFVAVPRGYNTLTTKNTNTLSIDSSSKLFGGNTVEINFDSNDDLWVRTVSDLRAFAGKPSAYSSLYLTVNNTLDNSGSIEAGSLADINFMQNSNSNLTQYAYAECHSAIAGTNEGQELVKTVNNKIDVRSGADITSGNDVEIYYGYGKGNPNSWIGWKTVSYALFGIPISNTGSHSGYRGSANNDLIVDGEIIAGQASSKYMIIDRYGEIVSSKGFYGDEYTVGNVEKIPGEVIKNKTLNSIKIDIDNVTASLKDVEKTINENQEIIDNYKTQQNSTQEQLDTINNMIDGGYEMKNSVADTSGKSEFTNVIQGEMKSLIVISGDSDPDKAKKITNDQFNTIMTDYNAKLSEIENANKAIFDENSKYENIDNQKAYLKIPTINEFLDTKPEYNLSSDQKTTISNGYNTVNGNVKNVDSTEFIEGDKPKYSYQTYISIYADESGNYNKYIAVSNPTTTTVDDKEVKSCDEIVELKNKLADLKDTLAPYESQQAILNSNKAVLNINKNALEANYTRVKNTDPKEYENESSGSYSITFNDIILQGSHIMVDGIDNRQVSGAGNLRIAEAGFKVDNYSTRSIVLNTIDLSGGVNAGVYIDGRNHSAFLNKDQALSGNDAYNYFIGTKSFDSITHTGVHYKDHLDGDSITGITINCFYDANHPFVKTFDIPFKDSTSSILASGNIKTSGDLNVWTESGEILLCVSGITADKKSIIAPNGNVFIYYTNAKNSPEFVIDSKYYIFGGKSVYLSTNEAGIASFLFPVEYGKITLDGTVKSGYSNRSITITEDMIKPENLIVDNTSGEKNLINLGGNDLTPYLNDGVNYGNLKAIYKDGQIYLYNLPQIESSGLTLEGKETTVISGNVSIARGYNNISIDNKTNAQLNVKDITNSLSSGSLSCNNGLEIKDSAKIEYPTVNYANTKIISDGKLVLDGVIKNQVRSSINFPKSEEGLLDITAKNGLEIIQQFYKDFWGSLQVSDSIEAYGTTNITLDGGQGDIYGNINSYYKLNIINNGSDDLNLASEMVKNSKIEYVYFEPKEDGTYEHYDKVFVGGINISNTSTGNLNISGVLEEVEGKIDINSNAQTNLATTGSIYNKKGDIAISSKGITTSDDSIIKADSGNITVTNNSFESGSTKKSNLVLNGIIVDEKGNIKIENNGDSASIGYTKTEGEDVLTVGHIAGQNGDIEIINNKGDMTITSTISHNEDWTANGMISIHNASTGKMNIQADIKTEGMGKVDENDGNIIKAISITNGANSGELTLANNISARRGNIYVEDSSSKKMITTANISSTGSGDVFVNIKAGDSDIGGKIEVTEGNVNITNEGDNLSETGVVLNKKGDINIENIAGTLTVSENGNITAEKGGVNITNNSADGATIAGNVTDKEGDIIIENTAGTLAIVQTGSVTDEKGGVNITNSSSVGLNIEGTVLDKEGNIIIKNTSGALAVAQTGSITNDKGDIEITNDGAGGFTVAGKITDNNGNLAIINNAGGIVVTTTGTILDKQGTMDMSNFGTNNAKGILVEGYIKGDNADIFINNENSNIIIGEYNSDNDGYINLKGGKLVITQTNGDILNGITDPDASAKHQNYDLANPNHAYKTLIATTDGGNVQMNVTDGNVGSYSNTDIPAGKSVDANTRDYTESINVNVLGSVSANVVNSDSNSTDERLVNIRAKESDIIIDSIKADGNIMITSADWKQADTRPTPDSESYAPEDMEYFTGYSVLRAYDSNVNVEGRNISIIASNNIGAEGQKLKYVHDSDVAPNSSVSFEAENDLCMSGKAKGDELKIYQILTKHGSIDFDMETNADIKEITAGRGLRLTQKAQNLTVRNLGMPVDPVGESSQFEDMLNPHDDLVYGPNPVSPEKAVIPNYVVIRVLDAVDTPERAESNLYIYSADVKGTNGAIKNYYEDGSRLADVTLMADNIYAASYKAPNSKVSTKTNPHGVKIGGGTYTNTDFDPEDTKIYEMRGVNGYGEGGAISVDIIGVDSDVVVDIVDIPQRSDYSVQRSKSNVPVPFRNKYDRTKFYDYDYKADNVYLSVNDYVDTNRGVELDTVYARNAYINTSDTNLSMQDGFINNYAEFRNKTKLAVVDNDYRRIVDSDMQLFTIKTGSFSMGLSNSTVMKTVAPVVDFNPYHLVNHYSSENSFVNLTFKETSLRQKEKDVYKELERKNDYTNKDVSLVYNTAGFGLLSDSEIYEVSRTGATINANDLKVGQKTTVKLQLNDIDVDVEAKVKEIHGDKATVQFLNMPDEISNQIMFEYMKKINSMKNSISSL